MGCASNHVNKLVQCARDSGYNMPNLARMVHLLERRESYEFCREGISCQHPNEGLQYLVCYPRCVLSSALDHHDLQDRACAYSKTLRGVPREVQMC
jgi:hypothetical protein